MLVFMEGGKPECPEKNPRSKKPSEQKTLGALVEGECSHHCAIPAPLCFSLQQRDKVSSEGKPNHTLSNTVIY